MIERTALPVEQRRVVYAHDFYSVHLREDFSGLFLDRGLYETEYPVSLADGEYYISLGNLRKIYAPDLRYQIKDGRISIQFEIYSRDMKQEMISRQWYLPIVPVHEITWKIGEVTADIDGEVKNLGAAPREKNGTVYIPVTALMGKGLGARVQTHRSDVGGNHTVITFNPKDKPLDKQVARTYTTIVRDKPFGLRDYDFWYEAGNRMITVKFYIPSSYSAELPQRTLFYFHGGHDDENSCFIGTENRLCQIAEKRGYMIFSCNGFIQSSFFGSLYPPLFTLYSIDPSKADYNNPERWSDYTLKLRRLALDCTLQQFDFAFSKFNIDRKNMFAMGNSAGSVACMHWALNYPEFFNRVVPTGGLVNYNFYDFEKLKRVNRENCFMVIVGSEDEGGIEGHYDIWRYLDGIGLAYRKIIVGGGNHEFAWTWVLPEIFDYFDEYLIK